MEALQILDCGHPPSEHAEWTTGYGQDKDGKTFCYACCAENDKAQMIAEGRIALYLTNDYSDVNGRVKKWFVSNWPGSLKFNVNILREGNHNIARNRYDVWFTGPEGQTWHGVTYGDNTQLCHCKRTKEKRA